MAQTATPTDPLLVSLRAPNSFAAEQYQGLRMTVERLKRQSDVRVVAVTSPGASDGKTTTAVNLAGALASGSDTRVLLIDADLRRPAVDTRLGMAVEGGRGLVDAIADPTMSLDSVTRALEGSTLSIVPAGTASGPIHAILRSPRFAELLQEARRRYEFVVIDTPPLLPVFDAALTATLADGVIVVVAANQTPRRLLAEGLSLLEAQRVLGIVFNRDSQPLFGYDSAYRRYFQPSRAA